MSDKTTERDGYIVDDGVYVGSANLPANAKLTDPVKVERLKERTRERILNGPPIGAKHLD